MTRVVPTAEWSAARLMSLAVSCGWAMPDASKLRIERNSQGEVELLDDENHVLDVIPTSAPMTASTDDSSIFRAAPQANTNGRKPLSSVPAIVQQDILGLFPPSPGSPAAGFTSEVSTANSPVPNDVEMDPPAETVVQPTDDGLEAVGGDTDSTS
ncbi:hypothetical protein L218DRAFT_475125 [Marasmius fiardii PR-910]|nr:hypothetical protein L218DRAFT_475125 [Marasmius fiardii PR-910]